MPGPNGHLRLDYRLGFVALDEKINPYRNPIDCARWHHIDLHPKGKGWKPGCQKEKCTTQKMHVMFTYSGGAFAYMLNGHRSAWQAVGAGCRGVRIAWRVSWQMARAGNPARWNPRCVSGLNRFSTVATQLGRRACRPDRPVRIGDAHVGVGRADLTDSDGAGKGIFTPA